MPAVLDRMEPVAKKPRVTETRERIDLRADPEFIERCQAQADRLNIGVSAYIKLATSERLEKDEATQRQLGTGRAN